MNQLKVESMRFLVVGAANFVLTFILFSFLLKQMKVHYLIALGGAAFCGMFFSYSMNFMWVFKPEKNFQLDGRVIKFLFTSLLSLAANILALNYFVECANFDPFYIQILLIPFIVIFNFTFTKYWSLRAKPHEKSC